SRIEAVLLAARPDIAAQKALLEENWHIVKSTEAEFYPNIELKVLAGMSHIDAFNLIRGRTCGL
ncbi:efflux transporter outer membrane subunit, partial [Neisseria sp. P0001.S003]